MPLPEAIGKLSDSVHKDDLMINLFGQNKNLISVMVSS